MIIDCTKTNDPTTGILRFENDLQDFFAQHQAVFHRLVNAFYDCRFGHVNIQTKHLRKYIKFGKFANSKKWIIRFKCGVKGSDKVDEDASCCVPDMALWMFHKSPFYVSIQFLIPCKMTEKH